MFRRAPDRRLLGVNRNERGDEAKCGGAWRGDRNRGGGKTAEKKVKGHRVTRRKCTTRLISGVATFTMTPTAARLTRGRIVNATGSAWPCEVTLDARRPVGGGRYTLTLRARRCHYRQAVVIG
jgi:hypothetical protein